jgi:hypothetical protein
MPRFDFAENATFPQLVERIIECSRSFEQMWPYFWIKAVAVRDGATWHLCQFHLVGRWSDREPIRQRRDKVEGGAVALLSHLVTASEAWGMLATLAHEGRVSLLPDVVAMAPHVPISNIGSYWKEPVPDIPAGIVDVIEQVPWRYLHIGHTQPWLANDFGTQARVQRAIQPDLDLRNVSSFQALLMSHFGSGQHQANQYPPEMFGYVFDLPLAIDVEHGSLDRQTNRLQLTVRCGPPLTVDALQVTLGKHWSSDADPVPVEVEVPAAEGWSFAEVKVPYDCGGISIRAPMLDTWLPHEIVAPSAEEKARSAVARLYTNAWTERVQAGEMRWMRDLLTTQQGARFEVALANALTRLGIPVLFGGEIERDGQVGGPATPGVDLVALDLQGRRASAISLKATVGNVSEQEAQGLLEGVNALSSELPGWTVIGILACRAPATRLERFAARTDLRVWGHEELEAVSTAENAGAISHLLWLPPWISFSERWQYALGHPARANR